MDAQIYECPIDGVVYNTIWNLLVGTQLKAVAFITMNLVYIVATNRGLLLLKMWYLTK